MFRKQLAKIGIGQVPEHWSNCIATETVEKPAAILQKAGMAKATAHRIVKADFKKTMRASTIVNDENLVSRFNSFLIDNSDLAHRSRDSYKLPGSDEQERARILKQPWDRLFQEFNILLESEGRQSVSKSCLRKIRKKNCKNFRQAAKNDIEYAMCSCCTTIDLLLGAARKNRYLRNWQINKDILLAESVCDSGNDDCLWNNCSNCSLDRVLPKVRSLIPNFQEIKSQMINYPELVKYKKKQSFTHKWIQQVSSIDEFSFELTNALFCSKTKATGSKVFFL